MDSSNYLENLPTDLIQVIWSQLDCIDTVMVFHASSRLRSMSMNLPRRSKSYFANYVARQGYLSVLIWAREYGCEMDEICKSAAAGGHVHIMQWARENGYGWDSSVISRAAINAHVDVLRWALDHGCPRCSCSNCQDRIDHLLRN